MKLLRDLGILTTPTYRRVRFGLYLCPECDEEIKMRTADFKRRSPTQCKTCINKTRATTHGYGNELLYSVWNQMRYRCRNKKHEFYKNYGERGITVCDEWYDSYIVFRTWALSNGYSKNLTIDRRDNDKGYEPKNCHWVTQKVQANNRRNPKRKIVCG